MAGSINKVILIGNIGKDPEIRRMNNGDPVATFSLATSETWKDRNSGERRERTEWHNIVVFNKAIVSVVEQYVTKGMKLYVEGQLQTRKWQDKDGNTRYNTDVVLQGFNAQLHILTAKGQGVSGRNDGDPYNYEDAYNNSSDSYASQDHSSYEADLDDDIPF